ncbi:MAG: glucose 1-dehydrogenase [Dehalococcoidia bacterium]|nr:glucose 1-dehydrogenase [Dehalococcoidia bacterium]
MGRLEGKVAIITGAASGIGEADAWLFAKEGAKVVIADTNKAKGEKVADDIKKDNGEAIFVKCDVSKESDWERLIAEVIRKYGKLNILVNNAGVIVCKKLGETSLDEWNWMMDINATGVFLGTKYAIGAMKNNGELCSIINRSSIAAMIGSSTMGAYCASKGAVWALTKAAAMSCAEAGHTIRVNSVHPGEVETPMAEKEAKDLGLPLEQYLKQMAAFHPIGIGKPIDVAYLDLYLASDESHWVTGSGFVIDGGVLAGGGQT